MKIIAIEGIVRAGKSTLVQNLNNYGFPVVKEYWEYSKGGFPPIAKTGQELLKTSKYFLGLETIRYMDSVTNEESFVLDRSFITCNAFDFACSTILGEPNIFREIKEMWDSECKKIIPSFVILLEVTHETMLSRLRPTTDPASSILFNKDFNILFESYIKQRTEELNLPLYIINTDSITTNEVFNSSLKYVQ